MPDEPAQRHLTGNLPPQSKLVNIEGSAAGLDGKMHGSLARAERSALDHDLSDAGKASVSKAWRLLL